MLTLDLNEVTRALQPILGHRRAEIVASATVEELKAKEAWVPITEEKFISETGVRNPEDGIRTYRNHEYKIATSRYRKMVRYFKLVRNDTEGVVITGWFKRIMFNTHNLISPTQEERGMIITTINDMIMSAKEESA